MDFVQHACKGSCNMCMKGLLDKVPEKDPV